MWWKLFVVFALLCLVSAEGEDDKPTLRVMAKSTVYNIAEKKAIYCQGTNLKERLEWYNPSNVQVEGRSSKNSRVFVERTRDENYSKSLIPLIIQSAQIKDSGNWTCKSGDLSETIEILVGEKVFIEARNITLMYEEGKTVRLDCVAKGSPTPVVQWYKDIVPLSPSEDRSKYSIKEKNDNYQLEIRNLNHLDAGEYVCKVTQEALSYYTDKRVHLIVQHKPLLIDQTAQEENMYTTKYKTQEIYAILNETKNISCNTIAYPPPTFEWHKRRDSFDERIAETDSIFKTENGTSSILMLRMYNESYLGEYKCSAKNNKGSLSIIFHVTLGNKPEPPDYAYWINSTASELLFNVTCSSCNFTTEEAVSETPDNLPILGYSFQLTPVVEGYAIPDWDVAEEISVDIVDPADTLFLVGPLQNSTVYYARVRSRNAAGFSDWFNIDQKPETTAFATHVYASITLLIVTYVFTLCYY